MIDRLSGHGTGRIVCPIPPALLLLVVIIFAGCTIPAIEGHAGTHAVPPSYGLNDGRMEVHFLDAGQGDSALILCDNATILIDAGEPDAGPGIVDYLSLHGVTDIDVLVATHPHSDHIGGIQDVFKNFDVKRVIDSGMPHTTTTYRKFLDTIDRKNISYSIARKGDLLTPAPGLQITVVSAPDGDKDQDLNEGSIVLKVTYGRVNFLFEGDATMATEESMINSGLPLESQVLKVAHHGSPHGTGNAFLDHVRPEVAIISLGKDNPYNYPAKNTISRLENAGTLIFRTDNDGNIIVRTDGMMYSVETEKSGTYPFSGSPPLTARGNS